MGSSMRRISIDFNTGMADKRGRIYVAGLDQTALLGELKVGERVVLFEEGLETEAVLEYDADYGGFYGVVDWDTMVNPPINDKSSDRG
jgi:hypothetical protein